MKYCINMCENLIKNILMKYVFIHFIPILGMACHLPGSFLSSVVSIIDAKSFASAIRQNILCGGN